MTSPMHRRMGAWWAERTGWRLLRQTLATWTVPARALDPWLLGAALCLALMLAATGLLLMVHYRPSAAEAHASVVQLSSAAAFGSTVRGVHRWSSELLILVLGAYTLSLLARRLHHRAGELLWLSSVALVGLVLALAFTGSVLPWSRPAHGHARVAGQLLAQVPVVGCWLRRMLLGGEQLTPETVSRVFALHVALLPAAATVVAAALGLLGWARRRQLAAQGESPEGRRVPVVPDLLVRQAALWTGLALLVAALANLVPPLVGEPGELSMPAPAGVGPAWYFIVVHQVLSVAPARMLGWSGSAFLVGVALVLLLLLLALPWLDRRGSRLVELAASGLVAAWLLMTAYGLLT